MSNIGIGTKENGKCGISFSADSPPLQPTPRVDAELVISGRMFSILVNLARQLGVELKAAELALEEANTIIRARVAELDDTNHRLEVSIHKVAEWNEARYAAELALDAERKVHQQDLAIAIKRMEQY